MSDGFARVLWKQVFCKSVPQAVAGDNVGVLLRGVKREFVDRGMFLGAPGRLTQSDHFAARLYVLTAAEGGRSKPLTTGFSNLAYMATWTMAARVDLGDRPMAMPGELVDRAELVLRRPMVLREGQRFVVRDGRRTVVSGIITDVLADYGKEIAGFNYVPAKRMKIESNAFVVRRRREERASKPTPT